MCASSSSGGVAVGGCDYRPVSLSKCVPVVHLEVWQWVGVTIGQ